MNESLLTFLISLEAPEPNFVFHEKMVTLRYINDNICVIVGWSISFIVESCFKYRSR